MPNDSKAKCDRERVIQRANRGVVSLVTELVKDEIIGTDPVTAKGTAQLKVILKQLNGKAAIISEFDRKIYSLCEESEVKREVEETDNVTAKIINYKRRIDNTLKPNTGSGVTANVTLPIICDATVSDCAKLSKLVLPRFKGDVTKWTSFWDSFDSTVHQNAQILKVDNLTICTHY